LSPEGYPDILLPEHLARRQRLAVQVIELVARSSRGYLARPLSVILVVILVLINGMNLPAVSAVAWILA
jgi:hypothetical protein